VTRIANHANPMFNMGARSADFSVSDPIPERTIMTIGMTVDLKIPVSIRIPNLMPKIEV
jgi:hypothetical protein